MSRMGLATEDVIRAASTENQFRAETLADFKGIS